MTVDKKISIDDNDAKLIEVLKKEGDPVFLGEYTPDYLNASDMEGLVFADSSLIAQYQVEIGFTLEDKYISALYMDLKNADDELLEEIDKTLNTLTHLKELFIHLPKDGKMFAIDNLQSLQYLGLKREGDQRIDLPSFEKMDDLSVLVVRGKVEEIHGSLADKENLQRLVVRRNTLDKFPKYITELKKLVWLEFGDQFEQLPDEITKLQNLVVMDVVSDNLTEIPDNFGELSTLQHLSIETDKIDKLPGSFGELQNLSDLYLWNLPMTQVPEVIYSLENLKYFWFKENSKLYGSLEHVSAGIGNLRKLVELQLNGHEIEELPDTITNLTELKVLNLGVNSLSELPENIGQMKSLERIELYLNNIEELPSSITDLGNLQYLDISDNPITKLPEDIAKLRNLSTLDAQGCPLEDLPEAITKLNYTKIRSLRLTLTEGEENLSEGVQEWIDKVRDYAERKEDLEIELSISTFEEEEEEDPELLEEK